jgi:hypothetical protein
MKKNKIAYTPVNIETLILVAVWERPFVFQGSFKLIDKKEQDEHLFFYRCESTHADKSVIQKQDFSPYDYRFTHLYRVSEASFIDFMDKLTPDALYLLKYALHISLTQMISDNKQYLTYIDEIALVSISSRVEELLIEGRNSKLDDAIGFAVAMDFTPSEASGQLAVTNLLSC